MTRKTSRMERTCQEDEMESFATDVFELRGEPVIVINGLPPRSPSDGTFVPCAIVSDAESNRNIGFGEWLEGREVQKLFADQVYKGKVTKFDNERSWYRVVYEDGDFEDLEWPELEKVLQPLDITVPLKTLAFKIIKKRQKLVQKPEKTVTRSRNVRAKYVRGGGNTMEVLAEPSLTKLNSSQVLEEASLTKSIGSHKANENVQPEGLMSEFDVPLEKPSH